MKAKVLDSIPKEVSAADKRTLGQRLIDLKGAYETSAINVNEWTTAKAKLIAQVPSPRAPVLDRELTELKKAYDANAMTSTSGPRPRPRWPSGPSEGGDGWAGGGSRCGRARPSRSARAATPWPEDRVRPALHGRAGGPGTLRVGDIVLCKVNGREYLHLVKAVQGPRFQIGNNRGRINGWVTASAIFGRCVRVED